VGGNLETTAVYHFLKVTMTLESLKLSVGRRCNHYFWTGIQSGRLSRLPLKSLRLSFFHQTPSPHRPQSYAIQQDASLNLYELKTLSLDCLMLKEMKIGKLGSSLSSVEILHLPFYVFQESQPRDDDFEEEGLLSKIFQVSSFQI